MSAISQEVSPWYWSKFIITIAGTHGAGGAFGWQGPKLNGIISVANPLEGLHRYSTIVSWHMFQALK